MTECTTLPLQFPTVKGLPVSVGFTGGDITSHGGVLLLRQAERSIGLIRAAVARLYDGRVRGRCKHSLPALLRQRIFGLALGEEDLNDHQSLRHDPALQTAVDCNEPLASASTLSRWENRATREDAVALHEVLVEQFIASHEKPPRRLILDVDATDDPVHGMQEGRQFHAYYDCYCFLPLYVFCGDMPLISYLRPSRQDGAKHAWAVLALLVKRLRREWPRVEIIIRGDSGFCRWRMLNWFDRHGVRYVIGIARNNRLAAAAKAWIDEARNEHLRTGEKQRLFGEFRYAARSWPYRRRVIVKAEHNWGGSNPRYLVTNMKQSPRYLYDKLYCPRGDMENRIKEQLDLFADRTSCHQWWANQFRLLLSTLAYSLVQHIRQHGLRGTEYARAQPGTIRLLLFRIGAIILRNTRRIRFLLSSSYPHESLFRLVAARLDTS